MSTIKGLRRRFACCRRGSLKAPHFDHDEARGVLIITEYLEGGTVCAHTYLKNKEKRLWEYSKTEA